MIETDKVKGGINTAAKYGIGTVVVLILLLMLIFEYTEIQSDFHQSLSIANWLQLVLGWIFMVLAIYILGFRWKVLLGESKTNVSSVFLGSCLSAGLLLNYAIPGPFGEIVGSYFVSKKYDVPMARSLAAMLIARVLGLFTSAVGAFLCYLLLPKIQIAPYVVHILMYGILSGALVLIFILFVPQRLPQVNNQMIQSMINASVDLSKLPKRNFSMALFWSVAGHILAFGGVYISLDSLGESPSILGVSFSYLTSTCCGVIAFLFPGSQFTWDAIFASLLVVSTNYTIPQAGVGVIVLRIEQIALMLAGAVPLIWLMKQYFDESK